MRIALLSSALAFLATAAASASQLTFQPKATLDKGPAPQIGLAVVNETTGTNLGCISDKGLWLVVGICGIFNVADANATLPNATSHALTAVTAPITNFTLTSLSGPCSLDKGSFSCSAKTIPGYFQANLTATLLSYFDVKLNASTSTFYSPLKPFGWMRLPILSTPSVVSVGVKYGAPILPPALD